LVIAGVGDMQRPAEKLSLTQNLCTYLKKKKKKSKRRGKGYRVLNSFSFCICV
jgi:hypothetical protein